MDHHLTEYRKWYTKLHSGVHSFDFGKESEIMYAHRAILRSEKAEELSKLLIGFSQDNSYWLKQEMKDDTDECGRFAEDIDLAIKNAQIRINQMRNKNEREALATEKRVIALTNRVASVGRRLNRTQVGREKELAAEQELKKAAEIEDAENLAKVQKWSEKMRENLDVIYGEMNSYSVLLSLDADE